MEIVNKKISDLKTYKKNCKLHPNKQIDLLVKNIQKFGFTTPLLIDKNNEIIAGHGRLEAIKKLNYSEVPCILIENLTEEEIKALRLADNKIAESGWDMDVLKDELKSLNDDLFNLTGFDLDLVIDKEENENYVPQVTEINSKLGDIYQLGDHKIMCGDCTNLEEVKKLIGNEKVNMIFTDPPYNVNYGATMKDKLRGKDNRKILNDSFAKREDFYDFLFKTFSVLREIISVGGAMFMWQCQAVN
jgi:site-specific DNA-methyltransferase (adenine-specific)